MKRTHWITLVLVLIFILAAVGVVYSVGSTRVDWYVFGGGGSRSQSSGGEVILNATLGQTAIGDATSSGGVGISSGYWTPQEELALIYLPLILR